MSAHSVKLLLLGAWLAGASSGGRIEGTITDPAGTPIANAQVLVVGTALTTTSNAKGAYAMNDVPPGTYAVRAQFIGYAPATVSGVRVIEGRTVTVDLKLQPSAIVLESVVVTGAALAPLARDYVSARAQLHVQERERQAIPIEPWRIRGQPWNREQYDEIVDNPFLAVSAEPLSTFSIDVDRASYSNVRRFILQHGRLPPRDAVRIEELLNYFPYDYAGPAGDAPVAIHAELAAAPWKPRHRLVRIGLQARRVELANLPPSSFVFLLDVSGSMQPPNKLPLVKAAMRLLVNELRPRDRVAIVVYAGAAGLVLPSTAGSEKQQILAAIDNLEAGGSTAGGAGIRRAYDEAVANFIRGGNNRVVLATDGDFNVGASSDAEMVRLIEEKRETGVFLTVLGVGEGNLQAAKMEKLADKGNGNYAYLDNLLEAQKVLVHELGGTLYTVAKDVKIQVEWNPARVRAYRLIGYENRLLRNEDFADDRKDAGEVGSGHSVTALYEIVPAGVETDVTVRVPDSLRYQRVTTQSNPAAGPELLFVKVRYKEPDGAASRLLTHPVRDEPAGERSPSRDFRFQAAVAEFGLLLRQSEHRGTADLRRVIAAARDALGTDPEGYRAEFVRIAQAAQAIGLPRGDGGR